MKKLLAMMLCFGLAGCGTLPTTPTPISVDKVPSGQCVYDNNAYVYVCNNFTMQFISDPTGAKIEIENNYIGDTPVTQRWNGQYNSYTSWIVKAYPTQGGQFVQTKVIKMNQLPQKVYFDLSLGPVTPSVDINANVNSGGK